MILTLFRFATANLYKAWFYLRKHIFCHAFAVMLFLSCLFCHAFSVMLFLSCFFCHAFSIIMLFLSCLFCRAFFIMLFLSCVLWNNFCLSLTSCLYLMTGDWSWWTVDRFLSVPLSRIVSSLFVAFSFLFNKHNFKLLAPIEI